MIRAYALLFLIFVSFAQSANAANATIGLSRQTMAYRYFLKQKDYDGRIAKNFGLTPKNCYVTGEDTGRRYNYQGLAECMWRVFWQSQDFETPKERVFATFETLDKKPVFVEILWNPMQLTFSNFMGVIGRSLRDRGPTDEIRGDTIAGDMTLRFISQYQASEVKAPWRFFLQPQDAMIDRITYSSRFVSQTGVDIVNELKIFQVGSSIPLYTLNQRLNKNNIRKRAHYVEWEGK